MILLAVDAQTGPPAPPSDTFMPGRLLAKPKDSSDVSSVHAAIQSTTVGIDKNLEDLNILVIHVPENARARVKASLHNSGLFDFVEEDAVGYPVAVVPNDTNIANQTWIGQSKFDSPMDSLGAWDETTGSASVIVGVIDSGLDGTHADLAGKQVGGWNFLTGAATIPGVNSDTGCNTGHGTAVSGTIGAATDNSRGIAGGAWLSPIMPLVVVPSGCTTYWSDIASAATWGANHGVKVLNISTWGPADSATLEAGLKYAHDHGVSIVAAAGNNNNAVCGFPSCSPWVVASMGAVNPSDVRCSFSNFGITATLYALGCNVYTTQMGGTYGYWYGTSFSSPIGAAAVALMIAANPALQPDDIKTLILANSDSIAAGLRLNAKKLVDASIAFTPSVDTTPPVVSITSPVPGAVVSGTVSVGGTATDNIAVTGIIFYVDGVSKGTATSPFTFSWDTTTVSNATHTLMVKASDAAGNVGQASLGVTVNNSVVSSDTSPPAITITSPRTGSTATKLVQVTASATDNVALSTINIFLDKIRLCTNAVSGTAASVTCNWNTRKAVGGSHSIYATGVDSSGNVGTSTTITVTK